MIQVKHLTKRYGDFTAVDDISFTLKTGHIWKELESADAEKHYFVPCPHCGKFIELKWAQVKFPGEEGMTYSDRAELAKYVCQSAAASLLTQTNRGCSNRVNGGSSGNLQKSPKR